MSINGGGRHAQAVKQLGVLDIPGGGQVVVEGDFAYVGHMKPPYGTSIIDISDKRNPRVIGEVRLEGNASHTHKVRVLGDVMITNVEQNNRHFKRRAKAIPEAEAALAAELGRAPSAGELAAKVGIEPDALPQARRAALESYDEGGFRLYDISDKSRPRLMTHQRTGGVGVHRFDADQQYAYISTEMDGYIGNILVVYDIANPVRPLEAARWWLPGQHVAGGETPRWPGQQNRLHHAMRAGDELWAAVWHAGIRVIDASDIGALKTIGAHDYHPAVPEPTHTVMPFEKLIGGRRIAAAIDEEHDHVRGRLHAFLWILDVTDLADIKPLSIFNVSELDSPFSAAPGRFGAHQYHERLDGTLIYATWFSGGLRIIDVKDPKLPEEVGFFIPEPLGGEPSPQSNDVAVDENGIIYMIDRNRGFHVLEFDGA